MMKVNLILFGQLKDIAGAQHLEFENVSDLSDLKSAMNAKYPALKHAEFIVAVNKKIVHGNIRLEDNAEIALLPPYSGG